MDKKCGFLSATVFRSVPTIGSRAKAGGEEISVTEATIYQQHKIAAVPGRGSIGTITVLSNRLLNICPSWREAAAWLGKVMNDCCSTSKTKHSYIQREIKLKSTIALKTANDFPNSYISFFLGSFLPRCSKNQFHPKPSAASGTLSTHSIPFTTVVYALGGGFEKSIKSSVPVILELKCRPPAPTDHFAPSEQNRSQ